MKNYDFYEFAVNTAKGSRLKYELNYIQHGNTSCLLHCIAVAYFCYVFAERFKFLKLHERDLLRGALLHDYFCTTGIYPIKAGLCTGATTRRPPAKMPRRTLTLPTLKEI